MQSRWIQPSDSGAFFDPDPCYRYTLWRRWDSLFGDDTDLVAFVGLNPSTADAFKNDPTIRRCISFAKDWGFGGMVMLNLFAFRATDPKVMKGHPSPVGPLNNVVIKEVTDSVSMTVCAWGVHGKFMNRANEVLRLIKKPHHLGLTADGLPLHPLYLKKGLKPREF